MLQAQASKIIHEKMCLTRLFMKQAGVVKWCACACAWGAGLWWLYGAKTVGRATEDVLTICMCGYTGNLIYIAAYVILALLPTIASLFFLKRGICEEYYYVRVSSKKSVLWARIGVIIRLTMLMELFQLLTLTGAALVHKTFLLHADTIKLLFVFWGKLVLPRIVLSLFLYLWISFSKEPIVFCGITVLIITLERIMKGAMPDTWITSLDITQIGKQEVLLNILLTLIVITLLTTLESKRDVISEGDMEKNESG